MIYVLVLTWHMQHDGMRSPVVFQTDGDDSARMIASALLAGNRYISTQRGESILLQRAQLYSLDDDRELDFNPWPQ